MALPLAEYLDPAPAAPTPASTSAAAWSGCVASREIGGRHPTSSSTAAPSTTATPNTFGELASSAAEFRFPYEDASFDFAFATSLFTHLLRDEASHYLAEDRRVPTAPGGRLPALTFFLLTPEAGAGIAAGRYGFAFAHPIPGGPHDRRRPARGSDRLPADEVRAWCRGGAAAVHEPITRQLVGGEDPSPAGHASSPKACRGRAAEPQNFPRALG